MSAPVEAGGLPDNLVWHSRRLWSWRDMNKIQIHEYIGFGRALEELGTMMDLDAALNQQNAQLQMTELFQELVKYCASLELLNSMKLLGRALKDLPKTRRELEIYFDAVNGESEDRLFFYVPPKDGMFWNWEQHEVLKAAFPTACIELQGAGCCYAYGEYTACVFHSMRAAEIALRVMANGMPKPIALDPALSNWHNVIECIESQIKQMQNEPKTPQRDENLQFFSAGASQFRYFKEAWRNHVSHARASYGEAEAFNVMLHVRDLIADLCPRLKEPKI